MSNSPTTPTTPTTPDEGAGASAEYCFCDLARSSGDFSVGDLASGETFSVPSEEEARSLIDARYPGARLALCARAVAAPGDASAGADAKADVARKVVTMAVLLPADDRSMRPVAYVGGAIHGPRCVPFSPSLWSAAVNLLGPIGPSSPDSESCTGGSPAKPAGDYG